MINVQHKNLRKTAFPRTGRGLDATRSGVEGMGGSPGSGSGGDGVVGGNFDLIQGGGILIDKDTSGKISYTISHWDTSEAKSIEKKDKKAIAGIDLDGYGHILSMDTCDLLGYDDLDKRYLRKDKNDTAAGLITFNVGWMTKAVVRSAGYNVGWEVETPVGWSITEIGAGWFSSVNARGPVLSNNIFGSPDYASGWTGYGSQWDMGRHYLETDYISVRKELKVKDLVVDQVRGTNGSLAVSDTNKIDRVEDKGTYWRCYIDDFEGTVYMNFRKDDVIKCQRWEKTSGKYYLAIVSAVEDEWFDLSKTLLEGSGSPVAGDTVIRWDNTSDINRKGLLYLTSSDSYAPYMDVRYGNWDDTVGTIKVREGRLDGINDPAFPELYGAINNFGLYTCNFYGTGELILRSTGQSVSHSIEMLKDSFSASFNELREEVYVSKDNVLQNPTFLTGTTDFWEFSTVAIPLIFGNNILLANGAPFSNLVSGAQIVKDGIKGRNVLQITATTVKQRNINFNGRSTGKYAISFYYRPIIPFGTLSVGIEGSSTMAVTVPLSDTSKWQKAEVIGDWDGKGDFIIRVSGGGIVNIVDIAFADDKLTNAIAAVKVDYDTKFKLKADGATLTSLRDEYDEFNRVVRRDYATQTWTATKIQSEVGTMIEGKLTNYSTTTQTSTMINNKVVDLNLGQYATTTWTSNQIRNAVSNIDMTQYATTTWTNSHINNKVADLNIGQYATTVWTSSQITNEVSQKVGEGEVKSIIEQTYEDMLIAFNDSVSEATDITAGFYKFDNTRMSLNRRIEVGTGSSGNFTCQGGISSNRDNVMLWAGGTYNQAVSGTAKTILYHDGTGKFTGRLESNGSGNKIIIDPDNRCMKMLSGSTEVYNLDFFKNGSYTGPRMQLTSTDTGGNMNTQTEVSGDGIDICTRDGVSLFRVDAFQKKMWINHTLLPKSRDSVYSRELYLDGEYLKVRIG